MFKDISQFNNIKDYLSILAAILIVLIISIILSHANIITSKFFRLWFQKFLLSAVLSDISLIFIFVIITRAIYNNIFETFSIINFIIVMLIIQIIYYILFYIFISIIPPGTNQMIDMFKNYANETSYYAIIGDSMMIIAIGLIASYLANFNANINIIILVISIYLLQFILYT
jgi:hypothetical protein